MPISTKPPVDGGAPPAPPVELPPLDADEGPMRKDLKRQIEALEADIAEIGGKVVTFSHMTASQNRGPAILPTAQLHEIRDELMRQRDKLFMAVGDLAD